MSTLESSVPLSLLQRQRGVFCACPHVYYIYKSLLYIKRLREGKVCHISFNLFSFFVYIDYD